MRALIVVGSRGIALLRGGVRQFMREVKIMALRQIAYSSWVTAASLVFCQATATAAFGQVSAQVSPSATTIIDTTARAQPATLDGPSIVNYAKFSSERLLGSKLSNAERLNIRIQGYQAISGDYPNQR